MKSSKIAQQIITPNQVPTQGLIAVASAPIVSKYNLKLEKFQDNLAPINYQSQQLAHQQTQSYHQSLISKVKNAKILQVSFVTGKTKNNNAFTDYSIKNYINNISLKNVPQNLISEADEAKVYYNKFACDFRDLCDNGSEEQMASFISSFYSPNNFYNAYFRGEMYNLIKIIHDCSNHKKSCSINSKDFAYKVYKLLDPSFESNSLNNLYIHNNNLNPNVNFFQKSHELLDAIDLARSSDSNVEIHITNDNDWNNILINANVDSSYKLVGNLTQTNMDLLVVDRINKLYYGVDLKTKFWFNGFSVNTNHLVNLGNVPQHERAFLDSAQRNQLLINLKGKLRSPNLTESQESEIINQIHNVKQGKIPLNTTESMLPHILTSKSSAVSAITYSNGDRPSVPFLSSIP